MLLWGNKMYGWGIARKRFRTTALVSMVLLYIIIYYIECYYYIRGLKQSSLVAPKSF